jgi:hypothetical protein
MKAVPLSVGFYADEDKSWADQDCLNLLPVKAEQPGGRSQLKLAPLAGLQEFAAYPDASRQRGGHVVEGRQFAVIDQSLCQLLPSGAIHILGTIPGTSRCAFAHNQITNGNQLFIATGTSAYVWNTVTSTLVQVTDTGFMGGLLAKFLGSRFITVDPARRFFQWSDLADGTEWNSSSFDAGESSPDRIRSIDVMGDDLVLLNERTIDFFAYTGTTNATFERRPNSLDRGCAASHATVKVDNALFFIGNDGSGYLLRGYQLQRITTHPIEQKWAEFDLSKAQAFLHEFEGHKIVYVTFPDADEAGTWGYDVATGLWHRRGSYGMDRWRLAWVTAWNGGYYGGEFNSGRVFRLNKLYPLEGSACIERAFSPGCLHKGGDRTTLDALRLIVERGPNVDATAVLPLAFDTEQDEVDGLTAGGDLPPGYVGEVVNFQYRTIGGTSPVTFAVTAGTLPAGVTLNPVTGAITGTYTTAADYSFTITATDAEGDTAVLADVNYVIDLTGDPPGAVAGEAYSYEFTEVNTEAPVTFSLVSGSFPTGTTLNASTGVLSGTADSTPATFNFILKVTDTNGVTTQKPYTINILDGSAVGLLADMDHWWSFDNNGLDSIGNADLDSSSAPIVYQSGLHAQEGAPGSKTYGDIATAPTNNFSFGGWFQLVGTSSNNRLQMSAATSGLGLTGRIILAINNGGTSVACAVSDADLSGFEEITHTVSANSRVFMRVNVDYTAKTADFFVDEVLVGTTPAVAVMWTDMGAINFRSNGIDSVASVDYADECWMLVSRKLTLAEGAYLYNAGAGKSYADLVADGTV